MNDAVSLGEGGVYSRQADYAQQLYAMLAERIGAHPVTTDRTEIIAATGDLSLTDEESYICSLAGVDFASMDWAERRRAMTMNGCGWLAVRLVEDSYRVNAYFVGNPTNIATSVHMGREGRARNRSAFGEVLAGKIAAIGCMRDVMQVFEVDHSKPSAGILPMTARDILQLHEVHLQPKFGLRPIVSKGR